MSQLLPASGDNVERRPGAASGRQPRVLHARVVSGAGGGPEKTILNSPRFLERSGFSALCVYLRHPADRRFTEIEARAKRWRAPLLAVDDHGPLDWRLARRLARICREERVDIWHGHEYKTNLLGLLARRSHPMRLVTTVHGWVERTWKTPLYYAIDRLCLPHYDRVICVSEDLYRRCLDLGVPAERCSLVPNAIDTEEFRRRRSSREAKRDLDIDPDRLVVGAIGRLSDEKGFDHLIRAVHELVGQGLILELRIAGEGRRRGALEDLVTDLELGDRVRLVGYQSDVSAFYHALDVFALSSLREGLPNVLLEAMAFELPILATRVAGVPKLIEDERDGLLVEPDSAAELSRGLRRLLLDEELRRRLGEQARSKVENSHSFAQRMAAVCAVYESALAAAESRR